MISYFVELLKGLPGMGGAYQAISGRKPPSSEKYISHIRMMGGRHIKYQ
jgi:hypothetical protein